jgi:hypothetical protein
VNKLVVTLLVILNLTLAFSHSTEAIARTYTTNFPLAENPISEWGNWIGGKTVGLDWSDISTTPGLAFGRQSGSRKSGPKKYDDSTALLKGIWGSNQSATGTVHSVNQKGGGIYEEVEIRLRSSLSAHICTGYEVLFRCVKNSSSYVQIVRWDGPLGRFTYLAEKKGVEYGISKGDVVKATIVGNVITAYINNAQVAQATDNTYSSGGPGMGFYLYGITGVNNDCGFTSFTASDEGTSRRRPH